MSKIFLVEDEEAICDILNFQLSKAGHHLEIYQNGQEAIETIQNKLATDQPDLFILDRMLPGASGVDICKFIKLYKPTHLKPILFLTALSKVEDIVEGLDAGADDYLSKPFDTQVLLARVRSLLRRSIDSSNSTTLEKSSKFKNGSITLDVTQCKVWIDQIEIDLTLSEFKLLHTFMKNSGRAFSRNQLVESIQDGPVHVTDRTIDTHIFGLRKKLGDHGNIIETIRGVGYRVKPHE